MIELSTAEENYLKAIYKIEASTNFSDGASTGAIAARLNMKAASVTDMLKKLQNKTLVDYKRYYGVSLTAIGQKRAKLLIRKHRLWEVFLVDKLQFTWNEVHPIAEQLEHIRSDELINRLDHFLGYPKKDPHGDPIPDKDGNFSVISDILLSDCKALQAGVLVGVKMHSSDFLAHLENLGLTLGVSLEVLEKFGFDGSLQLRIHGKKEIHVSEKVSQNLYVKLGGS